MMSSSRIRTLLFIAITVIVLGIVASGAVLLQEFKAGRQAAPIDTEEVESAKVEVNILPADETPSTVKEGEQGG
jgi:hypothetical protein